MCLYVCIATTMWKSLKVKEWRKIAFVMQSVYDDQHTPHSRVHTYKHHFFFGRDTTVNMFFIRMTVMEMVVVRLWFPVLILFLFFFLFFLFLFTMFFKLSSRSLCYAHTHTHLYTYNRIWYLNFQVLFLSHPFQLALFYCIMPNGIRTDMFF